MADKLECMKAPNDEVPFDSEHLRWPLLGSAKLDGMRVLVTPEGIFSRSNIRQSDELHGHLDKVLQQVKKSDIVLDCELWNDRLPFNEIMRKANEDKLSLYAFDMMTVGEWENGGERPFVERVDEYKQWVGKHFTGGDKIEAVDQTMLTESNDLKALYDMCLKNGLEGCVTRPAFSRYKHGRSTVLEGLMFKWKKWVTVDARIVGFKQATVMKEGAVRIANKQGGLKAVHSKEQRETIDSVGSIEVVTKEGVRFFANGAKDCTMIWPTWESKETYLNKWVEVRYQETGTKDKPRMPSIIRSRPDIEDNMTMHASLLARFAPSHCVRR